MKNSNQHNHPKKGDNITVEPIRRIEDIKSISKMLSDSPRNHLLFTMGINNGLRAGDLLQRSPATSVCRPWRRAGP